MALTPEEKATLEALNKKANEPDDAEDFEIEIYDGSRGARVPFKHGKNWLKETFGFDIGDAPSGDSASGQADKGKKAGTGPAAGSGGKSEGDEGGSVAGRYFGSQRGK